MFGRKSQPLQDASEEVGSFVHLEGKDNISDRGGKQKNKSEPSRGFFRKAGHYDELKDDVSDRSPSPAKSTMSDSSRLDNSYLDRDSSSTAYTQKSAALSARRSQGIADSLRSRFTGKDDLNDVGRVSEETRQHIRSPSMPKQPKLPAASKGKKRAMSSSQSKSKAGYDAVSASEDNYADSQDALSTPPRSRSLENEVAGHEPYSKRSPGLMSSAARFAASFGNSSKSTSSDRLKQMEDSALDSTSDLDSPADAYYSQFRPMSEAVGITTPSKPSRLGVLSTNSPSRPLFGESASPGATRPLLDASDVSVSPSPCPSPSIFPSDRKPNGSNGSFHTTTAYKHTPDTSLQAQAKPERKTDPLPRRAVSLQGRLGSEKADSSFNGMSSSESKVQRSRTAQLTPDSGVRRLPHEALNIFEPRPDAGANESEEMLRTLSSKRTMTQAIKHVENMTGHEALKALESGALLKKKWLGSTDTSEAAAMPKTERLIRCRMQNGKVVVHYHHKGVKGFLDKDEVMTQVHRVEVVDGSWREGDCLLLYTGKGVLALSAPDAATYTTWTLGLNAALTSSQQLAGDILLEAPVRAIPRDSLFVVKETVMY